MIVPAPAPVGPTAEQLSWRDASQAQALAAQVRMIGVARLRGEVGHPSVGHRPASPGLRERKIALKAQRPLQDLGAHAHGGEEPAPQLAGRDRQPRSQGCRSRRAATASTVALPRRRADPGDPCAPGATLDDVAASPAPHPAPARRRAARQAASRRHPTSRSAARSGRPALRLAGRATVRPRPARTGHPPPSCKEAALERQARSAARPAAAARRSGSATRRHRWAGCAAGTAADRCAGPRPCAPARPKPTSGPARRTSARDPRSKPKVTHSHAVQPSRDQQCALTTGSDELNLNPPR